MSEERSVTFKISADLYSILEDRALAVAKASGKRISVGAVAGRMVEEHFKCERKSRDGKRRPGRNKKASVVNTGAYMLEPDFRVDADIPDGAIRVPVIGAFDLTTGDFVQSGDVSDVESPAQGVPENDVVDSKSLNFGKTKEDWDNLVEKHTISIEEWNAKYPEASSGTVVSEKHIREQSEAGKEQLELMPEELTKAERDDIREWLRAWKIAGRI